MIALVSFQHDLIITRDEADFLGLSYTESDRFGTGCNYSTRLQPMSKNDYYTDELFSVETDGTIKYYTDQTMSKEVTNSYRYNRVEDKDWVIVNQNNNMVELERFALNCKHQYTISKCVKSEQPTMHNLSIMLNQIEEKFSYIDKQLDLFSNQQFNQKVNVHVGGGLIVTYNDLKLMEDSCTDALQSELNNGWRIIAVCVQPNNRRPDYILGRYNSELEVYGKTRAGRKGD
jgi:hypothetical protein